MLCEVLPWFFICCFTHPSEYLAYSLLLINISYCSSLGEEVALYCSKYLPDIIKEQKTYKDGKLQKVRSCRSNMMYCLSQSRDPYDQICAP